MTATLIADYCKMSLCQCLCQSVNTRTIITLYHGILPIKAMPLQNLMRQFLLLNTRPVFS